MNNKQALNNDSASDIKHINSWKDTNSGYLIASRKTILECLWCDYTVIANSQKEAVAKYQKEHVQPILSRQSDSTSCAP